MKLSVYFVAITAGLCASSGTLAAQDAHRSSVTNGTQQAPVFRGVPAYTANFETYTPGQLSPQGGWGSQFPNNAVVTEINPISGARSARQMSDGSSVPGFEMFSPEFANEFQPVASTIRISGMGSTYQLVTRDLTFGMFNTRVSFDTDGRIRVGQSSVDEFGSPLFEFVDTGVDWLVDVDYRVAIETFADGSLTVDLDGTEIFAGIETTFAVFGIAGKSGQFYVYAGNEGTGAIDGTGDTLTLDNVVVGIPAPGTLAIFGIGAAGLIRRKR